MRTLNVRLAAAILLGIILTAVCVDVLHRFQVRRNAKVFLDEAERAQKENRPAAAIQSLRRYVNLVPTNTEALAALGKLLHSVGSDAAYGTLEETLRRDPSRFETRRELVEVAITMAPPRFTDARAQLQDYLLKEKPNDPELLDLLGQCQANLGEEREAVRSFNQAILHDPHRLETYSRMASVLRQKLNLHKQADDIMERLVKANPTQADAHLYRAAYLDAIPGTPGAAEEALREAEIAVKLAPNDRKATWLAAECAKERKLYDLARDYAHRGLKQYPEEASFHTMLAEIAFREGDRKEGLKVLRAGLAATHNHVRILWSLANELISDRQVGEAREMLETLRSVHCPPALLTYLEARMDLMDEQWLKARTALEEIRPELTGRTTLVKDVDYWIAQCWAQAGNVDEQRKALERALEKDPFYLPARAGLAELEAAAGHYDAALQQYQGTVKDNKIPDAALLPIARLTILKNLHLPPEERDWSQADERLTAAEQVQSDPTQCVILRTEILAAQSNAAKAEEILLHAREKLSDKPDLWRTLAALAQRQKKWDQAEQYLQEAEKKFGDSLLLRLARGEYLVKRYGPKAGPQLVKLADNADSFSVADRRKLWNGLLTDLLQAEDTSDARRLGEKLAIIDPNNLRVRFLLFQLAHRDMDDARMARVLDDMEQVGGRGPMWLYGQAIRLSFKGKDHPELYEKAHALVDQARQLRPSWSQLAWLKATLYDQQGKPDLALEEFREAIRLGERNPAAVRRTVQLLSAQQRNGEAKKLLESMQDQPAASPSDALTQEWIGVKLQLNEDADALKKARESGADKSKDPHDQLWLGQVYRLAGQHARADHRDEEAEKLFAEAEAAYRRAVKLDPAGPENWLTLVQFLASTDKVQIAREEIERAKKSLPPADAPLALAQCYEVIGDTEQATQRYEAALALTPNDPFALRKVAEFYFRINHLAAAEPHLKRLAAEALKIEPEDKRWAKRALALALKGHGNYPSLEDALRLINQNLADEPASQADLRVKVGLLAAFPQREKTEEAIATLNDLIAKRGSGTPAEHFELAKLHLAKGDWGQYRKEMLPVLSKGGRSEARYIAAFVQALLQHDQTGEANHWLSMLEERSAPGVNGSEGDLHNAANPLVVATLRADYYFRMKRYGQVTELLNNMVEKGNAADAAHRAEWLIVAADSYEQFAARLAAKPPKGALEAHEAQAIEKRYVQAAEKVLRAYVGEHPSQEIALAPFLARQGRIGEALNVIERRLDDSTGAALLPAFAAIARSTTATHGDLRRAQNVMQKVLTKYQRPTALLITSAELATAQEDFAGAETLYREIKAREPANATVLNNLALLLAYQEIKLDESLALSNQAMEILGPSAALLDTQACVYIARGQTDKALDDCKAALDEEETPVRLFHEARAYYQGNKKAEAASAFDKAQKAGLLTKMLDPPERRVYTKMSDELADPLANSQHAE